MEIEKTFKTKTGFCHILSDKIVLTRDGVIGDLAKITVGNKIPKILIIYGIISIGAFYFAIDSYKDGKIFSTIFLSLIGVYLIYGIISSLNNSAAPIIKRDKIREIKLKKAIKGLTRARFEVIYENDNGKVKKRLIILPGSLTNGDNETQKAVRIMEQEKLLSKI